MSGLVYHQRKLKVNTLQIGNQKKNWSREKKNLFRINLSAWFNLQNENLVRTRFIKSETWSHWYGGGGEGVGEGVGKGGGNGEGKGVVYIPDLLLVILCKSEITFFQLETTTG